MNPHVSPSFNNYQHSVILHLVSFFFLEYFRANPRDHNISPVNTWYVLLRDKDKKKKKKGGKHNHNIIITPNKINNTVI